MAMKKDWSSAMKREGLAAPIGEGGERALAGAEHGRGGEGLSGLRENAIEGEG